MSPVWADSVGKPPRTRPLTPVEVERFGGLNLRDDPQEVAWSGAIDMLNVDLDREGRVRTRAGSTLVYTNPESTFGYWGLARHGELLVAAAQTASAGQAVLRAIRTNGTSAATQTGMPTGSTDWTFATLGTPSATYLYACNGGPIGGGEVWRYNGVSFVLAAASTYAPNAIGTQSSDNRLVLGSGSRVRFSDPGAPDTFGANNYVDVSVGDGEKITAIVSWQSYLFVFKQTKFFVFYGNSTDSTGEPVFNYRVVDSGVGCEHTAGVTTGPDGVYFLSAGGIYQTSGGGQR